MSDIVDAIRRCALVLLSAAAVLSLAAFIRSIWRTDEFGLLLVDDSRHGRMITAVSDHGLLQLVVSKFELKRGYVYFDTSKPPPKQNTLLHVGSDREKDMTYFLEAPRFFEPPDRGETAAGVTFTYTSTIPAMSLALLCSLYPVRVLVRVHRSRAIARLGKCTRCGYDLRATPGRCPECGPIAQPPRRRARGIRGLAGALRRS